MYQTSTGDRILSGSEATLFRLAAWALADIVVEGLDTDDAPCSGVELFDRMTKSQRLGMIEQVARALLLRSEPSPQATAIVEATIGAIWESVKIHIEIEIEEERVRRAIAQDDSDYSFYWRTRVSKALREISAGRLSPQATCRGLRFWDNRVEVSLDMILVDRDYLSEAEFMDASPEDAASLRQVMNIDRGYFVAIAPDTKEPPAAIHRRIARLCQEKRSDKATGLQT